MGAASATDSETTHSIRLADLCSDKTAQHGVVRVTEKGVAAEQRG
jgi:hypothetical protein